MCNLYNLKRNRAEIATTFAAEDRWPADLARDYVAPGLPGPVVIADGEGGRMTGLMNWGVPFGGKAVTNVRNLASPFWRAMLERPRHRCLVPATEFQEWSATADPATGRKRPHWFAIPSQPLFAFAGIWRQAEVPAGREPRFAFLTCPPNPLVGAVHPKAMPVILDETDYDTWLTAPWPQAHALAAPYPSQLMTMA